MNEYQMVCSGEGIQHSKHKWKKKDLAKARQSTTDANHHAEQHPDGFYNRTCSPYYIETREVKPWAREES